MADGLKPYAMDEVRLNPHMPALLGAAQTGRLKFDTNRNRFLLDNRYPDTDSHNTIVAMWEDYVICIDRAASEPGLVLVKPTRVGQDILDASMEG